jgi:hypothetical protein
VIEAHPGMHRGHDPFAIRRKAWVVEVVKVGAVGMGLDPARGQVIEAHAFRVIVDHVELGIFLRQEADGFAVRSPEWFARMVHKLLSIPAVNFHDIKAPHGVAALALIHRKANLRAVG